MRKLLVAASLLIATTALAVTSSFTASDDAAGISFTAEGDLFLDSFCTEPEVCGLPGQWSPIGTYTGNLTWDCDEDIQLIKTNGTVYTRTYRWTEDQSCSIYVSGNYAAKIFAGDLNGNL